MGSEFGNLNGWMTNIQWNHILDIGVMWFLAYQVYMRFRRTQAMRLLVRVFIVWLAYLVAQNAGLTLTAFLLWALWIAALIFFLLTFQREIQRILMRINPMRPMAAILRFMRRVRLPDESIVAAAESAFALASKRVGAIMVWERRDQLEPHLQSEGEVIDAEVRPAMLESLFYVGAPYHDGASYIQEGKIYRAGCVLPLSENPELAAHYGTRHRAAAGITERSDAIAIVVSEERGEVSVVEDGQITSVESSEELNSWLNARLRGGEEDSKSRRQQIQEALQNNWRIKVASLAAVVALWGLAYEQKENPQNFFNQLTAGVEEKLVVPVEYYNLPDGLRLDKRHLLKKVTVRLKGRRDLLNFLDVGKVRVTVNLENYRAGDSAQTITSRNIDLPSDIRLIGVDPPEIAVRLLQSRPQTSAEK